MSRHSKRKKKQRSEAYSSGSGRRSDCSVELSAIEITELKSTGWTDEQVQATNALIEHFQQQDLQQKRELERLQRWLNSKKLSLPSDVAAYAPKYSTAMLENHFRTLLRMAIECDPQDPDSDPFLGSTRAKVEEIGADLNAWGGMNLMQAVASYIPKPFQRDIDFAWNGIGAWRA